MATWTVEDGPESKKRPSASVVLDRLKRDVDHWGKSVVPLVPKEWQRGGGCPKCPSKFYSLLMTPLQRKTLME